jgi:hypothetical protein
MLIEPLMFAIKVLFAALIVPVKTRFDVVVFQATTALNPLFVPDVFALLSLTHVIK